MLGRDECWLDGNEPLGWLCGDGLAWLSCEMVGGDVCSAGGDELLGEALAVSELEGGELGALPGCFSAGGGELAGSWCCAGALLC